MGFYAGVTSYAAQCHRDTRGGPQKAVRTVRRSAAKMPGFLEVLQIGGSGSEQHRCKDRDCLNHRTIAKKEDRRVSSCIVWPAKQDNSVCLSLFSCCCDEHHKRKEQREERTYFSWQLTIHHRHESRQELDVEAVAGTMEHCFLACSLAGDQLPLLYGSFHPPRDGTAHGGLDQAEVLDSNYVSLSRHNQNDHESCANIPAFPLCSNKSNNFNGANP